MKIAYIANSIIPGMSANSVHVMKMCEALKKNGADVTLIISKHFGLEQSIDEFAYYGIEEKFKILRVGFSKAPYGIWNLLFSIWAIATAKKCGSDVIYTRSPIAARLLAMGNKEFIFEYHGVKFSKWYSEKKILHADNLRNFVVITNSLKDYYIKNYNLKEDKILVLPDAVNLDEYKKDGRPLFSEERLKLAYVGGLYQGRGVDIIIEMAKQDPDNDYLIVGGRKEQVEFWKKQLNGSIENLTMMGQIPNADVPDILLKQDILLMPHQKHVGMNGEENIANWTSPMKMFEYMASGRVILSSNLPVLQEILEDKKNAYLLKPDRVSEWLDKIKYISSHKEEARAVARQAKEDVKAYTWEKRTEKIIQILKAN